MMTSESVQWPRKVVVLGAGGWGREVMQILLDIYRHDRSVIFSGFLDDQYETLIESNSPVKKYLLGPIDYFKDREKNDPIFFVPGIGDPVIKADVVRRARELGYIPINAIHPRALILNRVRLGRGIAIQPGAIIAVDAILDDYCSININCSIGHDSYIGRYATISPLCAISGNAQINEGVLIGSNAVIFPGVNVGEWAKVGALAGVIHDVNPYTTVTGCPAKVRE